MSMVGILSLGSTSLSVIEGFVWTAIFPEIYDNDLSHWSHILLGDTDAVVVLLAQVLRVGRGGSPPGSLGES